MHIVDDNGWLGGVKRCYSPNVDARPEGVDIDLLVVHCISLPPAEFGTQCVEAFFCNSLRSSDNDYFLGIKDLRVSAHLFINRVGELTQFASLNDRAWHAGLSSFEGRSRCNDFSIGVELEGCDDIPYTLAQYLTLARVSAGLISAYPGLNESRITGHEDIAPGRKTDPGPSFDWNLFFDALSAINGNPV